MEGATGGQDKKMPGFGTGIQGRGIITQPEKGVTKRDTRTEA